MKEISLPLPNMSEDELIDIKLIYGKEKSVIHFKIIPFLLEDNTNLSDCEDINNILFTRICILKKLIENFDKSWELLQIFAPLENSKHIQVLYRKKLNSNY